MKSRVRTRLMVWGVPVLCIGVVLVCLSSYISTLWKSMVGVYTAPLRTSAFDRAEWRDEGISRLATVWNGGHTRRQEMVDDLIGKYLHVGMPMNEVLWLIGDPDKSPYFAPGEWTYCLGAERNLFGGDNEWLAIDFDERGRVERVWLDVD
jgi:hypothetical protein